MAQNEPREILGMSEEELLAYLEELLREHATEVAAESGSSPAEELAGPGFTAARAAMSYGVQLIAANNAYLTRHLLDLGVIPGTAPAGGGADASAAERP